MEEELNREVYSETSSLAYEQHNNSQTRLLNHDLLIDGQDDDDARIGVEFNSLRSQNAETSWRSLSRGATIALDMLPNINGKKLWCSSDFWLLF